jgi:molybdopterin-guanine dinucleotide biosynthesis protein A
LQIDAVILAGGEGRRMGGADKALLVLEGRSLLAHVAGRLRPQVGRTALSANGDPARFAAFDLPVLPDARPLGPLAGILSGLGWGLANGVDAILSCPVDAPFPPADLAARLAAASGGSHPAHATAGGRMHAATALWPVALAPALAAFLASGANPRIADFAAAHGSIAVEFPDAAAFVNLNTTGDLAAATAGRVR